jgi:superfamily I DNA/RNA helicase
VYPGGFRLADAGVDIKGRGVVLRTNYRNAAPIFQSASELVSGDPYNDLDGPSPNGHRTVDLTYHDGRVVRAEATDQADQVRRLVEAINGLPEEGSSPLADAAVLCRSRREVEEYHRLLPRAGIRVMRLEHYDGRSVDAIKLGTYRRAKGLEFKYVFLPGHDAGLSTETVDGAERERAELHRRQLFVAMTRARDLLWLGSIAGR